MLPSDSHMYSSANLTKSLRLCEYAISIMTEGYWESACAKEASGERWRSPFLMEPCPYKQTSELACDLTEFAIPATSSSRAIFFSWDHISWTTSSVNISWIEVGIVKVNEGVCADPLGLVLTFIVNNVHTDASVGRIY